MMMKVGAVDLDPHRWVVIFLKHPLYLSPFFKGVFKDFKGVFKDIFFLRHVGPIGVFSTFFP